MTRDDVRWGLLGAGRISWTIGGTLTAARGGRFAAVASRDPGRAAALADAVTGYQPERPRTHSGPDAYAALIADPGVDAVYIGLPPSAHLPWTLAALDAGKPVLCEKPLALDAAEVDAMADAAERAGRLVVEASMWRWHPRTRLMERRIADGAIGPVRHVSAAFSWGSPPPGDFRLDPALGGGALLDVGCYAVSGILAAVRAPLIDAAAQVRRGPSGVDLDVDGVLAFAGDVEAEVHASIDGPMRQDLIVRGEAGEIELRPDPYTALGGVDSELWLSDGRGTERIPVPAADPFRLMLEEVGDVVAGGSGYALPLSVSRDTAAALTALRDSAAAGGSPVPPA